MGNLLMRIAGPEDVRALDKRELPTLCADVRQFILDTVLKTGGHLGSNLGIVEATVALHYCFDFLRDRLVFDVSHQVYPHKILTGRGAQLHTIRQTGGISGFCHIDESPYDMFTAGHAGTAISAALGLRCGFDHAPAPKPPSTPEEEGSPWVVSLVGDAGLGAGVAFEGLNHAGDLDKSRYMVVLNDNEWSISKSVGALAKYLSRIRTSPLVHGATKKIEDLIAAIPMIGGKVVGKAHELGNVLRHLAVPGHIFEELGITYVGPIDGHDVVGLVDTLQRLKKLDGVVLLHLLTQKGKGYDAAKNDPERGHAAKPPAKPAKDGSKAKESLTKESHKIEVRTDVNGTHAVPRKSISFTQSFANHLKRCAERDPRVVAITAAMPSGTGLVEFSEKFPTRFYDTGITEQHAVAFCGGLARAGARPVAAIYSTFLQRGYDQVFQEVALQRLPVVFALDRGGLVGQDGPTHNGVFDLAYLRAFPGFVLCSPRDDAEMGQMLDFALRHNGPVGIRYPRANCEEALSDEQREPLELGRGEWLQRGERVALVGYGPMSQEALSAARRIESELGFRPSVVNARFAKPVDGALLAELASSHRLLVTIEDHTIAGGFGSACLEELNERGARAELLRIGVPDQYIEHMNSPAEQHAALGMDAAGIARRVAERLR
ncbi:MAG: 1-deoxy-D-xylulose-5-phosphate synthase [Planctomycetes bacterium]|nr:1-deoxy-D-xylulose-5-phosphate synthase [Planctomycetota bacterium]